MPVDSMHFVPTKLTNRSLDAGELGNEVDDTMAVEEGQEDEHERQYAPDADNGRGRAGENRGDTPP